MIYALNVFNLIPGFEDQYRDYSVKAGKIIYRMGGRVVAAGTDPLRNMHGDRERRHMIVVEFPSEEVFQNFIDEAERDDIHRLRETATRDYIWTLYKNWDMRIWVKAGEPAFGVTKTPLVLLPGLLCDRALWAAQIKALADVANIWVADLTGQETMREMGEAVLREAPFDTFALAGLSMGGYVAMEVMRQAPQRVRKLALLDTSARPEMPEQTERRRMLIDMAEQERGFTPVTRHLLPLMVHASRIDDQALVAEIRAMAERVGVPGFVRQQRAIMSRTDFRPGLKDINCPTLVLCGREDALTPLEGHEEMARLIPGAKLEVIEGCGHMSTMERPGQVSTLMREWLRT
jgi:pimeloyl-ACP methyl ester carboxylesterase